MVEIMNKSIFLISLGMLLTSCANMPNNGAPSSQRTSSDTTANQAQANVLKDLDEPGPGLPRKGGGVEFKKNRIATFSSPASVVENNKVASNCTSLAKLDQVKYQGKSLVDEAKFQTVMVIGVESYKTRKAWEDNLTKNSNAESTIINGRAYTSFKFQQQAAEKARSNYPSANVRLNTKKVVGDILNGIGLHKKAPSNTYDDKGQAYDELFENINYNKKVLATQDTEISNQEKRYIEQVSQLYFASLNNLLAIPKDAIDIATLNNFSKFRQDNIYQCVLERIDTNTPWPQAFNEDYALNAQSPYYKYAQSVISQNGSKIVATLNSANSSDSLKTTYYQLFETKDLRSLVEMNPTIANAFASRANKLAEVEKKRYEAYLHQQAKEAKLLEKAKIEAFKQKIKNNLAPSKEDVLPLLVKNSMNRTANAVSGTTTDQTSNNSYAIYANVLGTKIPRGNISIDIQNLNCKKSGNTQICTYKEVNNWVNIELFGALVMPAKIEYWDRDATFYWTETGLMSNDVKAGYIGYIDGGSSSSSSGYDDSKNQRRNDFLEESANRSRYMRQQDISGGRSGPYDSSKQY